MFTSVTDLLVHFFKHSSAAKSIVLQYFALQPTNLLHGSVMDVRLRNLSALKPTYPMRWNIHNLTDYNQTN